MAVPGETLGGITLTTLTGNFDLNDPREIVFDGFSGSPAGDAVYGIVTLGRRPVLESANARDNTAGL